MPSDRAEPLPFARPWIGDEEVEAVTEVLRSGWLTTGARTHEFERRFAESVGAPAALALSSGTAALHLALIAAGVGADDVVLTTPLTFCSTVHVVEHLGARPVLVDIDPDSLNISPVALARAVEQLDRPPKVILPVHLAGRPVDLAAVHAVAEPVGATVVEDAAHAQGASVAGRPIGALTGSGPRQAACFSFYVTKNTTTGEGGMLTGDEQFVADARRWSLHGMSKDAWRRYDAGGAWRYDVTVPGFKYNMTDLEAALGLVQLGRAEFLSERRRQIAAAYDSAFADLAAVRPVSRIDEPGHAWHLYLLQVDPEQSPVDRDGFIARVNEAGIGTSVHFIPIHHLDYYRRRYGFVPDDFPVASAAFARLVSLPIYPRMTDEDVTDVIDAVRRAVEAT